MLPLIFPFFKFACIELFSMKSTSNKVFYHLFTFETIKTLSERVHYTWEYDLQAVLWMQHSNEESFWIYETNNCYKNVVYSVECWFINVNFVFFLLFLFILFGFDFYSFLSYILFWVWNESQTWWMNQNLACATPVSQVSWS